MIEQGEFYTLKGYQQKEEVQLTAAMEDYLEMICRLAAEETPVRVKALAGKLHVKPSSASKMVNNLQEAGYLKYQKYGCIALTETGKTAGSYLLSRHQILHDFLCTLNQTKDELEQAEKIEHFLTPITVANLERLTARIRTENKS